MRLRSAYFVTCTEVVKDADGRIVGDPLHLRPGDPRRRCAGRPAAQGDAPLGGRRDAVPAEVRLYDHLFTPPGPGADGDLIADLNPASETVVQGAMLEPSLADVPVGQTVQFERLGYFTPDPDSRPDALVFDRTLTLKDSWAKVQAR